MQSLNNLLIRDPCYFLGPDSWVGRGKRSDSLDKTIMGPGCHCSHYCTTVDWWWWLIRVPNGAVFRFFSTGKTSTRNETLQKGKWVGKGKFFQRCHFCVFFFRFEFMKYKYSAYDSSLIKIRSERNENKIRQLYIYIYIYNIYNI